MMPSRYCEILNMYFLGPRFQYKLNYFTCVLMKKQLVLVMNTKNTRRNVIWVSFSQSVQLGTYDK